MLLVPTGWNQELTAPDSAADAHDRFILVFLILHPAIAKFLVCEVLQSYDKAVSISNLGLTLQNHVRKYTQSLHKVVTNGLSDTRETFHLPDAKVIIQTLG